MRKLFEDFYNRYFDDEESVILLILLLSGLGVLLLLGNVIAPLITAIIIAYLMQGLVNLLLQYRLPKWLAFGLVYTVFIGLFTVLLVYLIPRAWDQLQRLMIELPNLLTQWQQSLMALPENYPTLFSQQQIEDFIDSIRSEVAAYGQRVLEYSLASIYSVITWIVFLVLVPILVFFMMRDKDELVRWSQNFLPRNRPLMSRIWREMDQQIANYVRGKFVEILIVGSVSYIMFSLLGLNYSLLLSVLVGLSVIVPYIGATVATIPVAVVAYVQWGIGGEFATVLIAYGILQLLDGNVLVPVIFSEAVNLHPVAIIAAVLVFGGWWGLAGVFFAIPLATLIKAIINSWPSRVQTREAESEQAASG
ncbi:MAG: AI-2E family transporter [Pseudohongiellaceae bacterium]